MTSHRTSPGKFKKKQSLAQLDIAQSAPRLIASPTPVSSAVLPLGAMLLAGSLALPVHAQTPPPAPSAPAADVTLKPVIVRDQAEPSGKDSVRTRSTSIGKGKQELRDIPQSITVVTEKLIDDRNLDTLKEVLHNTAGITFLAAEGGEEDIRLRGFSLAGTGDIFLDGLRDPAFYDRDTFNHDRVELLRGSASMLFGRGSTGGAANQVTKQPSLFSNHEAGLTLGSHQYRRVTGDFNFRLGESTALRLNAMHTTAQNDGKGNGLDKSGLAVALRTGIGEKHEFSVGISHLDNRNPRMNYGLPWLPVTTPAIAGVTRRVVFPGVDPKNYYGLDSDYNAGTATIFTAGHLWRIAPKTELKTQIRRGLFTRDQRASAIRFTTGTVGGVVIPAADLANIGPATLLNRNTNLKIQNMALTQVQSDLSHSFEAAGYKHDLIAGIDYTVEDRTVFGARNAAQGGVVPVKPRITVGGDVVGGVNSVDESSRILRTTNDFRATGAGVYVQDTWHLNKVWKLVGGLRYDDFKGKFNQYSIPNTAPGPVTQVSYQQPISELSKRLGVLYQPDERTSYHFSYGTSFNTSGDAYSYNARSANTPPEQSRNIEIGAKIDSANKRFTTRYALFYAEKFNERNTDPDTASTTLLLSGARHTAGVEFDITGRITQQWEIYGSYAWTPKARVDKTAPCPATGQCLQSQLGETLGARPGLIPKHSGTIWNTYQLTPQWRLGAGINFRSKQKAALSANEAVGYATVDLLAEYRFNDTYTVKANLNNVANKYYADSLYRGHYVPGTGRVLQVNMTARF